MADRIFHRLSSSALLSVVFLLQLIAPVLSCPAYCSCSDTSVDCSNQGLVQIPQGVPNGTTRLNLRLNSIRRIKVGDFRGLVNVEVLDLSDNSIRNISYGVFDGLYNLQTLNLSANSIKSIARGAFTGVPTLLILDLSKNSVANISRENLSGLPNLKNLTLRNNNISTIFKAGFTGLDNLQNLDLSDNAINAIRDGAFDGLQNLQTLSLHKNGIRTISSGDFSGLDGVMSLDLSNNSISSILRDTFRSFANITELNLQNNSLTTLPPMVFQGAVSLRILRLNNNQISAIAQEAFVGMPPMNYEFVDLRHNRISAIKDSQFLGLRNCKTLNLGHNTIDRLPDDAFNGAEHLVNLDLRNNRISNIQLDAFKRLMDLETMNLRGNLLTTIPKDTFFGLESLTHLDLSLNDIDTIRGGSFAGLDNISRLDLSNNSLAGLPGVDFTRQPALRVLYLNNNPWSCDCELHDLIRWIGTTNVDLQKKNETICAFSPFTGLVGVPLAVLDITPHLQVCSTPRPIDPSTATKLPGTTTTTTVPSTTTKVNNNGVSRGGLSSTAIIAVSVVACVAIVTMAACVLGYLWTRKRQQPVIVRRNDTSARENHYQDLTVAGAVGPSDYSPAVPRRSQFPKYELDRNDLDLKEEIGRGAFGVVYLATRHKNENGFPTEETVVVKNVHAYASREEKSTFVKEIETTINLGKHPNLLGLVGCCTVCSPPYMVTEYMPYGDLKGFLLKCRKAEEKLKDDTYDLSVLNKYQIARQIANGMIFISEAGYVHGDLAARNVLVTNDLVVKIADFGLATDVYERGYQRQDAEQKIPVRWMAPERLLREGRYTSKSDVWSFGVVLFEIATLGNVPYPGMDRHLMDELRGGYREPRPEECPQEMYALMLRCWQWEEDDRPEFPELYEELDQLMEENSEVSYLQPFGSPEEAEAAAQGASAEAEGVPEDAQNVSAQAEGVPEDAQNVSAVAEDVPEDVQGTSTAAEASEDAQDVSAVAEGASEGTEGVSAVAEEGIPNVLAAAEGASKSAHDVSSAGEALGAQDASPGAKGGASGAQDASPADKSGTELQDAQSNDSAHDIIEMDALSSHRKEAEDTKQDEREQKEHIVEIPETTYMMSPES